MARFRQEIFANIFYIYLGQDVAFHSHLKLKKIQQLDLEQQPNRPSLLVLVDKTEDPVETIASVLHSAS